MKAFGLGFVMALALVEVARAEARPDLDDYAWKEPKAETLRARWPRDADGRLIYGEVKLDCAVGADGHPVDCRINSAERVNPLLEQAALALAPLYTAGNKNKPRRTLLVSVKYDTEPAWLNKPTLDDMLLIWPRTAAYMGISGYALIKCVVNLQGLLQACTVPAEYPAGRGFGAAALQLAPTLLMTPATRDGQPVEAEVTIPINFRTENGAQLSLPNALVVDAPVWSKTPSVAEIMEQIDKKVGDKFADGKVVFMCNLNKTTGKLSACAVENASPGMAQFRNVANAIVSSFEADPKTLSEVRAQLNPTQTDAKVILPFAFPDMASPGWGKRYITHVQWARSNDPPPPGQPTFPDQALKTGLKTGAAMVDCQIGSDGRLSQCDVVSESMPGVGFGALAKTIAETWVANRWTEEGLPVDGARVRLPIKMAYGERASVDTAPAPTTKP